MPKNIKSLFVILGLLCTGIHSPVVKGRELISVLATASGGFHSCADLSDNTTWCWGYNSNGQLGLGDRTDRYVPAEVKPFHGQKMKTIAAGGEFTCAVTANQSTWCWGYNDRSILGVGLLGSVIARPAEVLALRGMEIATLGAGSYHYCALTGDGAIWCAGGNYYGQLGIGGSPDQIIIGPVLVNTFGGKKAVKIGVGGFHNCAVLADNTTWCWGWNPYGQLGVGDKQNRMLPTEVQVLRGKIVTELSIGGLHTCVAFADKTVWCWGMNNKGQLGLGDTVDRELPEEIIALRGKDIRFLKAGHQYTCAVMSDNATWCWGDNYSGQLGLGDRVERHVPTRLPPQFRKIDDLIMGGSHACVRMHGLLKCWGQNSMGQLGSMSTSDFGDDPGETWEWSPVVDF